MAKNKVVKNAISLYAYNIAKMIIPLVTLPYLTRILSKNCYGVVAYIKAFMQYMQLLVDFGFLLSGTKDIINCINDKKKIEQETSAILAAKVLMSIVAGVVMVISITCISLLRKNITYTILSFIVVFLSCFMFDYFFRGIEEMQVIAVRFVTMKTIAAVLTFVFVKNDSDVLWIPILDIIGSLIAILMVLFEIKKRHIRFQIPRFKNIFIKIKESAVYFVSDIATTAFGALNTLLVGIYCTEAQVADWSLCMQMIVAVQSMYTPLTNSIYPEMVRTKNSNLIKKIIVFFMPIVVLGCIFTLVVADKVLLIIGGTQYINAALVLRCLIPVLLFSFPGMLLGWPTLGAIGRVKETTKTTVITAVVQIIGLVILIVVGEFNLVNIALLRGTTEFLLLFLRWRYFKKFKKEFCTG